MADAPRPWTVLPHGPLEKLEENLYAIESEVPGLPGLKRRMAIVRLSNGGLLFFNAVPVNDETVELIRALGTPAILIVPQHLHMIDAHAFRERLSVKVFAPAVTRARIERSVKVDGTFADVPPDPAVSVLPAAGFSSGEGMALVRSGERVSLLVADVVLNVPNGKGLRGLLFKLLGMTGKRPKLPALVKFRVVKDANALRSQLESLAKINGLVRIVTSHGAIVENDAQGVLGEVARSL